jgi:GAF domain-containing protein
MAEDLDDATLSVVAHNLRGAIGLAAGATRTVRLKWDALDADRRNELLELAERGMTRVDDAMFGIARGLPAEVIADLQEQFERDEAVRPEATAVARAAAPYPLPDDEEDRLGALRRYGVLDRGEAPDLDAVVRLAARITETPVAVINLLDGDRQWQAAAFGVERGELPREQSMCAYTILDPGTVVIEDSRVDERFADHPWVTGELGNVRLYAAAKLIAPVHHVVGTLCVFAEEPQVLTADQVAGLEDLARIVISLFEERALVRELQQSARWQAELIADLERERRRNDHLLERLTQPEA